MLGAIIGDIVGSKYEFDNIKTKEFKLFDKDCFFTDDSVMTLAVAKSLLEYRSNPDKLDLNQIVIKNMHSFGKKYPNRGYGGSFLLWLLREDTKPYNSFGNGAAMSVSSCGFAANSLEEAKELSKKVTEVTHNHREGLKGAEATAVAVYMAKIGLSKFEIRKYINKHYYKLDFTLDDIRPTYEFNETCQDTVPQAIEAFLESESFEDAIRNAISIGGDSDTLAAITGAIAEAYYGIPKKIKKQALSYLDSYQKEIIDNFYQMIYPKK